MSLAFGASATYTGKMYTALTDEPLFRQGAYAKINFNIDVSQVPFQLSVYLRRRIE